MPNYVTFKIIETRDGEFVLYLHNHDQKLISEQHRSTVLDEVVNKLREKIDYRRHFMNAQNNYAPVLQASDKLEDKYPDGKGEDYPVGWTDPLDLYGAYQCELIEPDLDMDNNERMDLQGLMDEKGPGWVWRNRQRLVAEQMFIRNFLKKKYESSLRLPKHD
jgi:hypothetical protein